MSKKFIPVMLCLLGAGLFIGFRSMGGSKHNDEENPKIKYAKILRNVGILLEEGHYDPKRIDDSFSEAVMKRFEGELDDERNIFLASDIASLKKYQDRIDDEIHGAELQSFFAVNDLYNRRMAEVQELYLPLLAKPFDFSMNESINMDTSKLSYPKDEAQRRELWRKKVKFLALGKYSDLLDQRDRDKDKKDFKYKPDTTLERESRDYVRIQLARFFSNRKNTETEDQNFSTFVNCIAGSMDPHTDYFAPVDLRSFNESMKGSFYGIGALLKDDDGHIKIESLVSGMPAWKTGEVKENDEVLKVGQGNAEPVDVTGYAVADVVKLIRGTEKGSEVKLTLKKIDGSVKVVSILRDDIHLDDVFAHSVIIQGGHKIGYIYLPEFYADFDKPNGARCAADVAKELEKLKAEHVDGIVLDLRGNGGGSLYDVVQMAGLFIEDGPIVQVRSRGEKPTVLRDRDKSVEYSGPFAVMVDETSASASEIFAAAIQDYHRGVIIGSTSTYGKGTVQRNIPLNPESENPAIALNPGDDLGTLKLTLQKFYRINGGATQLRGVVPDVILPDRLEYLKFREKDNPYALGWDEIPKADYKVWQDNTNMNAVISAAKAETAANPNFNKIETDAKLLDKQSDREYSLNLKEYRAEQKQFKDLYKDLEAAYKLPAPIAVQPLAEDTTDINSTKEKTDRSKAFVKRVSSDIYIDESVKVLDRMIMNDNFARKN